MINSKVFFYYFVRDEQAPGYHLVAGLFEPYPMITDPFDAQTIDNWPF